VETSSTTTTSNIVFNSRFRHGVDPKRRVQVPSKWRSEKGGDELTVVIWRRYAAGACLRVLPPLELEKIRQTINALPAGDPSKSALRHLIGANSEQVTLDSAGRLLLPERMAQEAGLNGDVEMVGLLDFFEIWNPERYTKVEVHHEMQAPDAFKQMD
jgi:MraZ protein